MWQGLVGLQGVDGGQPVMMVFRRTAGDFLAPLGELPVDTTARRGRAAAARRLSLSTGTSGRPGVRRTLSPP